jgi:hypothetical protein
MFLADTGHDFVGTQLYGLSEAELKETRLRRGKRTAGELYKRERLAILTA